jgi:SAM-dependent methyltransferase
MILKKIDSEFIKNTNKSKIQIHSVDCPLCRSKIKKPLYIDLVDVEDFIPGKYDISECLHCGLIYLSTRPTEISLPYCYRKDYHVRLESSRSKISKFLYSLKHQQDYYAIYRILHHIPNSLIDIGCGSGGLLLELRRRWGKRCNLAGIDLAPPPTDILNSAKIDFFIGNLEKIRPVRKYEIVVMNEILEHVYDPVRALRVASRWLTEDGLLIGEVPHFESPWRKIFPNHWQGFQIPRHMTFFNENTIAKVLDMAGFKLISTGNRFNVGDISVSLCNLLINRFASGIRPRYSNLYIILMILTAPLSVFMFYIVHAPAILEFVAVKKK